MEFVILCGMMVSIIRESMTFKIIWGAFFALTALALILIYKKSKIYFSDIVMPFAVYFAWGLGNALTEMQWLRSFSLYFVKSLANLVEPFFILPVLILALYLIRVMLSFKKPKEQQFKVSLILMLAGFAIGFVEAIAMPGLPE